MKKFSEISQNNNVMLGDKLKINEVVGKEIIVTGYQIGNSRFRREGNEKMLTLQFKLNGIQHILFTGSKILMRQIEQCKDEIPFITIIEYVNKFYTFT